MKQELTTVWKGDMAFETELNGHKVLVDADESVGGKDLGPRPKPLMLVALTGCTGMDVVSILKKMREPCTWFQLKVEADMTEEHPKHYSAYKIIYQFKKSDGLNPENVKKAVALSQDKYCGVSAALKAGAPLEWEIAYL